MDIDTLKQLVSKYAAEQREDEVAWFYKYAMEISPEVVLEIGVKEGGNFKILSTLLTDRGLAIGIDQRKEIPWKMDDSECEVTYVVGDSHSTETVKKVKEILGSRYIDILFIDGDHSYAGMLEDFDIYSPLVRKGGIIAVHDIYYLPDVTRAWQDIQAEEKFESPKNQSSIGIGFIIKK